LATVKTLRDYLILCGHAEGISFLLLLFVAMPMKYAGGMPLAVTIAGSLHGVLFIAFLSLLWESRKQRQLPWGVATRAVGLAVTPFGTFFLERLLARHDAGPGE